MRKMYEEIGFIFDIRPFPGVLTVTASRKPHQFTPGWYYFVQKTKSDISQALSTRQNSESVERSK